MNNFGRLRDKLLTWWYLCFPICVHWTPRIASSLARDFCR